MARPIGLLGCLFVGAGLTGGETLTIKTFRHGEIGSVDESYPPVPLAMPVASLLDGVTIRTQMDGNLLVLAYDSDHGRLFRVKLDGTLDSTFSPDLPCPDAQCFFDTSAWAGYPNFLQLEVQRGPLTVQHDGRILVASGSPLQLVRLLPSGARDPGFRAELDTDSSTVLPQQILVDSEDRILLTLTPSHAAIDDVIIRRLQADGSIDASFHPQFSGAHRLSLALQPDGKLIARGAFTLVNGTPRTNLVRLLPNGSIDLSFAPRPWMPRGSGIPGGLPFDPELLALTYDGKILTTMPVILGQPNLIRLNQNGELDEGFASSWVTDLYFEMANGAWLGALVDPVVPASVFVRIGNDGAQVTGAPLAFDHPLHLMDDGTVLAAHRTGIFIGQTTRLELVHLRAAALPLRLYEEGYGTGTVHLQVESGMTGAISYVLERSSDLRNWQPWATFQLGDSWSQTNADDEYSAKRRFFRVRTEE